MKQDASGLSLKHSNLEGLLTCCACTPSVSLALAFAFKLESTGYSENSVARLDDPSATPTMSSNTATVFKSHHEVMEALHQNFAGADDAQKAIAIDRLRQELSVACQMQQDEVKSTIQGQWTPWHVHMRLLMGRQRARSTPIQNCLNKCKRHRRQRQLQKLQKPICVESINCHQQRRMPKKM